jgi:tRNA (guanine-N7-)-methyltransferase
VTRRLKYDIPGADWRLPPECVRERVRESGWPGIFAPDLSAPARLVVDVGFGRGEFLMGLARSEPDTGFLGIEVSFKRLLKMARRLARTELRNVRLVGCTAERVVGELLPEGSVSCFWINFPDPWPKKRHHRRRLIDAKFVGDLASRLQPGGALHIATDHLEYAEVVGALLAGEPLLENLYAPEPFRVEVPGRSQTAYEVEWRAQGWPPRFFAYGRRKPAQRASSSDLRSAQARAAGAQRAAGERSPRQARAAGAQRVDTPRTAP